MQSKFHAHPSSINHLTNLGSSATQDAADICTLTLSPDKVPKIPCSPPPAPP